MSLYVVCSMHVGLLINEQCLDNRWHTGMQTVYNITMIHRIHVYRLGNTCTIHKHTHTHAHTHTHIQHTHTHTHEKDQTETGLHCGQGILV